MVVTAGGSPPFSLNQQATMRKTILAMSVFLLLVARRAYGDAPQLSPVAPFLVDLQAAVVGVVEVKDVRDDWIITADQELHLPVMHAQCRMLEAIQGGDRWANGSEQELIHVHNSDNFTQLPAPALVQGRRYIVWADPVDEKEFTHTDPARWMANARGIFLLRGPADDPYFAVEGTCYSLKATRDFVRSGVIVPLDQIDDPLKRIKVARHRLETENLGSVDTYVHGLLRLILEVNPPTAAAKTNEETAKKELAADVYAYDAISILRDTGQKPAWRPAAVAALRKALAARTFSLRLPAAIALAQLNRPDGRSILVSALHAKMFVLFKRGAIPMPNRFPFEDSSRDAAAYALGLLHDEIGLSQNETRVQLAAASALVLHPTKQLKPTLMAIAARYDKMLAQNAARLHAMRKPGDVSERLPIEWVLARSLLARLGDNESLRKLVSAWLADYATYPQRPTSIAPRENVPEWAATIDGWPNPLLAIMRTSSNRMLLFRRMQRLFAKTWDSDADVLVLRSALGDTSVPHPGTPIAASAGTTASEASITKPDPVSTSLATSASPTLTNGSKSQSAPNGAAPTPDLAQRVEKALNSQEASQRARALAAAGFNRLDAFYPRVLKAAREGHGDERAAAIYGLGWYDKPLSDADGRAIVDGADSSDTRLSALELVTRTHPEAYAEQSIYALREILHPREGEKKDSPVAIAEIVLVLTRMSHGNKIPEPIRDGLFDPDERMRGVIVQCLALGGNPAAIPLIQPLRDKASDRMKNVIERALIMLGPPDP